MKKIMTLLLLCAGCATKPVVAPISVTPSLPTVANSVSRSSALIVQQFIMAAPSVPLTISCHFMPYYTDYNGAFQMSTNNLNWTNIYQFIVTAEGGDFSYTNLADQQMGFFRAVASNITN